MHIYTQRSLRDRYACTQGIFWQVNFQWNSKKLILFKKGSHFRSPWQARPLKQQKMYPHHQKSKQPGLEKVCLIKSAFFLRPQPWPAGLCLGFASAGLWASARASEKHFQRAFFYGCILILETQNIYSYWTESFTKFKNYPRKSKYKSTQTTIFLSTSFLL